MVAPKTKTFLALTTGMFFVSLAAVGAPAPSNASVAGSISQNEIALYEAVLASWFDGKPGRQLVDYHLGAPPSVRDPEIVKCTKGLNFSGEPREVESDKTLVGAHFNLRGIELTDGTKWNPNDPGRAIANGTSVGTAVSEGVSHSLISFSQPVFSRDGNDALVKFSMVCGSLCGSGSTLHLHKTGTDWKVVGQCGGWIS